LQHQKDQEREKEQKRQADETLRIKQEREVELDFLIFLVAKSQRNPRSQGLFENF